VASNGKNRTSMISRTMQHHISPVCTTTTTTVLWPFVQDYPGKPAPEGWTILDFSKAEAMKWQWHQLGHAQVICTSLQTDNAANTSSVNFFMGQFAFPAVQPTVSKRWRQYVANREVQTSLTESRLEMMLSRTSGHSSFNCVRNSGSRCSTVLHTDSIIHTLVTSYITRTTLQQSFCRYIFRTTWVSWYQKDKLFCVLVNQEMITSLHLAELLNSYALPVYHGHQSTEGK